MALIAITNLNKQYTSGDDVVEVLRGVDLSIEAGEFITIMGQSGSGKSTLLSVVGGMSHPTTGDVEMAGIRLYQLPGEKLADFRARNLGFVFQSFHLIPYLTAVENVMLSQYFHSVPDEAEARSALERVGLGHRLKNRPGELSGGEQQRVCIARAIINSPKLLLGDEPTGNLDNKSTVMVMDLLKELRAEERFTVVMVTHNQEVAAWGDRTIYLDDGVLVREERVGA